MAGAPEPRPAPPGLSDRTCARLAWLAWLGLLLGMGVWEARALARDPTDQVANHVYERASEAWMARESLYLPMSDRGFLYLPQAAILYVPFARGELIVRHVAVRTVFACLLLAGVLALARVGHPGGRGLRFLVLTLTALPLSVQSMRQGQMNLPMTGALLLATAALATGRWAWCAAALAFALGLKPLALVLLLLTAGVAPRRMGARLAVALLALGALPFLTAPPDYVLGQYAEFGRKMVHAGAPPTMYYDLRGLLETGFGVVLPTPVLTALRVVAGLAVLAVAWRLRRRLGLADVAVPLYVLAACYLMLFNPKTEDPTYVVLGPALGMLALHAWERGRGVVELVLLVLWPLPIALAYELFGNRRVYWFRPALAAGVLAYALVRLWDTRRGSTEEGAPEVAVR